MVKGNYNKNKLQILALINIRIIYLIKVYKK